MVQDIQFIDELLGLDIYERPSVSVCIELMKSVGFPYAIVVEDVWRGNNIPTMLREHDYMLSNWVGAWAECGAKFVYYFENIDDVLWVRTMLL